MDNWQQEQNRQNIYNLIKDQIENIENINFNELLGNSSDPMGQIQKIVHCLSSGPTNKNNIRSIRQLCENQEQKVFIKLREMKEYDLYDEMNRLNSELNLKNLSMNQLTNKWSEIQEKIKVETDDEKIRTKIEEEEMPLENNNESNRSQYSEQEEFENICDIEEDDKSLSEAELTTHFFQKLQDLSKHNSIKKHNGKDFSEPKKFFDCNLIHNLMTDDFGSNYNRNQNKNFHQKESWGNILREIDMNDEGGFNYLDDI